MLPLGNFFQVSLKACILYIRLNFCLIIKKRLCFSLSLPLFFLFCYDLCMKECSEEGRCSADTINSLIINHSVEISKCATALQTLYLTSKSISFTNFTLFLSIASNIFTSITFQIWKWQSTRMAYISSQCTQHTKKQPKVLVT